MTVRNIFQIEISISRNLGLNHNLWIEAVTIESAIAKAKKIARKKFGARFKVEKAERIGTVDG